MPFVNPVKSPIAISYRDEGNGKGAFYDHYTIRRITQTLTVMGTTPAIPTTAFANYLNYRAGHNEFGLSLNTNLPESHPSVFEYAGLLFIPGRARETEDKRPAVHEARTKHEQKLIREAVLHGQPILAVCAGSWQLWEYFGGHTVNVTDHNYGAGMPRILNNGKVGYNKQIHRIKINAHSLLAASMGYTAATVQQARPSVNSVHWAAPDTNSTPDALTVTAYSVRDDSIAPNSRQGGTMAVQANTAEAFETKHGAPILGVQWHPEAYNVDDKASMSSKNQLSVLQYMAEAGHTYQNRRRVVQELKDKFRLSTANTVTLFSAASSSSSPVVTEKTLYPIK